MSWNAFGDVVGVERRHVSKVGCRRLSSVSVNFGAGVLVGIGIGILRVIFLVLRLIF